VLPYQEGTSMRTALPILALLAAGCATMPGAGDSLALDPPPPRASPPPQPSAPPQPSEVYVQPPAGPDDVPRLPSWDVEALRAAATFDHGCPAAVDLDVCGVVRRYRWVSAGSQAWLDVTALYPASSLPPPLPPQGSGLPVAGPPAGR
jgi:hypothetical protein